MSLRPIDYIGLGLFLLLQLTLLNTLSITGYLFSLLAQVIAGIGLKLYNMWRLEPSEIRERKNEEGLSGLFC